MNQPLGKGPAFDDLYYVLKSYALPVGLNVEQLMKRQPPTQPKPAETDYHKEIPLWGIY